MSTVGGINGSASYLYAILQKAGVNGTNGVSRMDTGSETEKAWAMPKGAPPGPPPEDTAQMKDLRTKIESAVSDVLQNYSTSGDTKDMQSAIQSALEKVFEENKESGIDSSQFQNDMAAAFQKMGGGGFSSLMGGAQGGQSGGLPGETDLMKEMRTKIDGAVSDALKNYSGTGTADEVEKLIQDTVDKTLKDNGVDSEQFKKDMDEARQQTARNGGFDLSMLFRSFPVGSSVNTQA